MSYQDSAIEMTRQAIDDLFRVTRAMPADKLEWKPLEAGRSALEQLQECAQAPSWFAPLLVNKVFPDFDPEQMKKAREASSQWKTIDECERVCRENSEKLFDVIRDFPDADLPVTIHLPFGGGMDRSLRQVILFHHWNLVYHLGQINYIQTLYGDMEMH